MSPRDSRCRSEAPELLDHAQQRFVRCHRAFDPKILERQGEAS
jgi:hypothetical protein